MTMDEADAAAPTVVLEGVVLPGPTMAPPYTSDARCVIWAAARDGLDEAANSGAVAFLMRLDDGRDVVVQPAGATAVLPVRLRLEYQLPGEAPRPGTGPHRKARAEADVADDLVAGGR